MNPYLLLTAGIICAAIGCVCSCVTWRVLPALYVAYLGLILQKSAA